MFWYSLFASFILKELARFSHQKRNQYSLKEYLHLESLYHPMWVLRWFYRQLYQKCAAGMSFTQIARQYRWISPDIMEMELSDFHDLLAIFSRDHPVSFPYSVLIRILVILVFQILFFEGIFQIQYVIGFVLWLLIMRDAVGWAETKTTLVKIYFMRKNPRMYCIFEKDGPVPSMIRKRSDLQLWKNIWKVSGHLLNAVEIFSNYWEYHQCRVAGLRRNFWQMLAQIYYYGSFIALIDPLLTQLYQPSWIM